MAANTQTRGSFAFVKMGGFSHANDQILAQLRHHFADLDVDAIDILDFRIVRKSNAARILLEVANEYGIPACFSRHSIHRYALRTPYFFEHVRQLLLQHLQGKRHSFVFQTQSLFDASVPGVPHFLYTDHTHLANLTYPGFSQDDLYSERWIALERSIYHKARINFTMSSNISRSLVSQYGCAPQKVRCVYAGKNASAVSQGPIDADRFKRKNILFVGVDWERKGGPALIEAFRLVRKAHPDARLTIVGCSPHIDEPGCHVVGNVPLHQVSAHYRTATVFCMPTLIEPFGLVFLEAFDHGLPVVATRIGAIPDFVSDASSGYLVAPGDAHELADRLVRLLNDPELCAQFGQRGQEFVSQHYTWAAAGSATAMHIRRATSFRTPAAVRHERFATPRFADQLAT